MNELPQQSTVDHPLDRRAVLVAIGALQLSFLALVPVIWKEHLRNPGSSSNGFMHFVEPLATSLICMIGFAAVASQSHWFRRLVVGSAACLWTWSALFAGYRLAGEGDLSGLHGFMWMITIASVVLCTAFIFYALKRVWQLRLVGQRLRDDACVKSRQFRLRDLMLVVLLVCVTSAGARLGGPISLPPVFMFTVPYCLDMATIALMGSFAILAAFSRKLFILFLFVFPSLVCFDVALILLLQLRVSQWTQYAPLFLKGVFIGEGILAANCILTMLLVRWLGYRLEFRRR